MSKKITTLEEMAKVLADYNITHPTVVKEIWNGRPHQEVDEELFRQILKKKVKMLLYIQDLNKQQDKDKN